MKRIIALGIILLFAVIALPSYASSPDPAFTTSPITAWHTNVTYAYNAHVNQTGNFTLKSNSTLVLTQDMSHYANDTSYASVWGKLSVGSYWVNLTFNGTSKIWQNYTLTVSNEPYIISIPNTFYQSMYYYNYAANEPGNYTYSLPSGFAINTTSKNISGNTSLFSGTYALSLTITNKNGSYTQDWEISDLYISTYTYSFAFQNASVSVKSPSDLSIGQSNNSLYVAGEIVATFPSTGNYTFQYNSSARYTITASSSNEKNVTMEFNGLQSKLAYIAYVYNGSKIFKQWIFVSNSSGYDLITYNPADMPLDPVFIVAQWYGIPIVIPPTGPISPTQAGNYILSLLEEPYIYIPLIVAIIVGVIVISSARRKDF